jgi:hypothetical protein
MSSWSRAERLQQLERERAAFRSPSPSRIYTSNANIASNSNVSDHRASNSPLRGIKTSSNQQTFTLGNDALSRDKEREERVMLKVFRPDISHIVLV